MKTAPTPVKNRQKRLAALPLDQHVYIPEVKTVREVNEIVAKLKPARELRHHVHSILLTIHNNAPDFQLTTRELKKRAEVPHRSYHRACQFLEDKGYMYRMPLRGAGRIQGWVVVVDPTLKVHTNPITKRGAVISKLFGSDYKEDSVVGKSERRRQLRRSLGIGNAEIQGQVAFDELDHEDTCEADPHKTHRMWREIVIPVRKAPGAMVENGHVENGTKVTACTYNVVLQGTLGTNQTNQPPLIPPPAGREETGSFYFGKDCGVEGAKAVLPGRIKGRVNSSASPVELVSEADPKNLTAAYMAVALADQGQLPARVTSEFFQQNLQQCVRPGQTTVEDIMGLSMLAVQKKGNAVEMARLFDLSLPGQMVQDCLGRHFSLDVVAAGRMANQIRRGSISMRHLANAWVHSWYRVQDFTIPLFQKYVQPDMKTPDGKADQELREDHGRDYYGRLLKRNRSIITLAQSYRTSLKPEYDLVEDKSTLWNNYIAEMERREKKLAASPRHEWDDILSYTWAGGKEVDAYGRVLPSAYMEGNWMFVLLSHIFPSVFPRMAELNEQYVPWLCRRVVYTQVISDEDARYLVRRALQYDIEVANVLGYETAEDLLGEQCRFVWKLSSVMAQLGVSNLLQSGFYSTIYKGLPIDPTLHHDVMAKIGTQHNSVDEIQHYIYPTTSE